MNNASRSDVRQLASVIENLARQVQEKADNGGDLFNLSEELVRNNVTFTFVIGEVIALERAGVAGAPVKATTVTKSGKPRNYSNNHNVRGAGGRFVPKP